MSTHVFPLAGPLDAPCAICNKTRSTIEREDAIAAVERDVLAERIATIKNTIKVQLTGAGLAIVDESKLQRGYGDYALVYGAELDRAVESIARNILQAFVLELP